MKRSVLHALSQERLEKTPTKQPLGRLRRLHEGQESALFSDLTPDAIAPYVGGRPGVQDWENTFAEQNVQGYGAGDCWPGNQVLEVMI